VEDTSSFASMSIISDKEIHYVSDFKAIKKRTEITEIGFGGIRGVNRLGQDASLLMVVGIVWQ
jgi:hypothetical protein